MNKNQLDAFLALAEHLSREDTNELVRELTEAMEYREERKSELSETVDHLTPIMQDIFFPYLKRDLANLTIR
jgi:hypothetical protein